MTSKDILSIPGIVLGCILGVIAGAVFNPVAAGFVMIATMAVIGLMRSERRINEERDEG